MNVKKVVKEIVEGTKQLSIKHEVINSLYKNGKEKHRGVEFLSCFMFGERGSEKIINGGELFKATSDNKAMLVELDKKALEGIRKAIQRGWDDFGKHLPESDYYCVNLTKELIHSDSLFEEIEKFDNISDSSDIIIVYEISEKMDDLKDYKRMRFVLEKRKKLSLALDDTYYLEESERFFRTPIIYQIEFKNNINFIKLDREFFKLCKNTTDFPNTLKALIKEDANERKGDQDYGRLIVEGVEGRSEITELKSVLKEVGCKSILIQGFGVKPYEGR